MILYIILLLGHHLEFFKKVLLPLEPILLVTLGRIGKALQIVCEVLHTA
jgi:hypothetical protein